MIHYLISPCLLILLHHRATVQAKELLPELTDYECDPGYYFDKEADVCSPSTCHCENGVPVSADACPIHNDHVCFSCNKHYYLTDDDLCLHESQMPEVKVQKKKYPTVVCRNGNIRKAELTLVEWLKTDEFLSCTDLLLSTRIGNTGDYAAKAIAAALIRAGSRSHLENLILTGGAISDDGAEWLAAAIGGPVPEYEDDDGNDGGITVQTKDYWVEDGAAELMAADFEDEYEKNRATQIAEILRDTIGIVHLPKFRKKDAGLPPIININLFQNRIGDTGAEAFAEAINTNRNIRTLHLSQNMITIIGLRSLVDAVKRQKKDGTIEQLWLDGNSFDEEARKIRPLLHSMRRILDKNEKIGLRKRGINIERDVHIPEEL
jgi:hypothetical protein